MLAVINLVVISEIYLTTNGVMGAIIEKLRTQKMTEILRHPE